MTKYKKAKAHIQYRLVGGTRIPGTTTITGILNKPALIYWANNIGLEGINVRQYVDELANAGTLAHRMVECEFTGEKVDTSEYSAKNIDLAENSLLSFLEWRQEHDIKTIGNEMVLVSEKHKYGGMIDIYCKIDDVYTLIDLKTSKALYDEHFIQVTAYRELLIENDYPVDDTRILRIGRTEDEGFEDRKVSKLDLYFQIFQHCKEIYELQKAIKK